MVAKVRKQLNESKFARWLVLILASFTMATNYYFYDALSPLADLIRLNLGFSSTDYGFIVSAYSIPNVFLAMAVLGGIILDRVGIRLTGFTFVFLMGLGGLTTAYGASETFLNGGFGFHFMNSFLTSYSPALKMMSLGFFLFGLGAETSIVVLSKVIVKWFRGKELALALGLNLAIGRLGAALAFTLSPRLIHPEWTTAIWFGAILLWVGMISFLFYIIMDIKLDRQTKIDIKDPEDQFRWSDLKDLVTNPSIIYITLLCVTFYSAVFPFLKFAPDFLMNKFNFPRALAGDVTSYLMYGTILLTPLFGWIADNKGKSATLMYLGSALLIVSHLMFAKTYIEPRIPIVLLGIAFSLVPAAMWPAVAKIVKQSKLGTAYGFMFSVQNIGLWAFPMLIGLILDSSNPFYRNQVMSDEFRQVQEAGLTYNGIYINRHQEPVTNKIINVNASIHKESTDGPVIWREIHHLETDNNGRFSIELGKGTTLTSVDFSQLDLSINYQAEVTRTTKRGTITLYDGPFSSTEDMLFIAQADGRFQDHFKQSHSGSVTILDMEGQKVWEERIRYYLDENGEFEIIMGFGRLAYADPDYFGLQDELLAAEIVKPLDYTNAMLLFSLLGFAGLIFAFLLKREDKTSGYGLEQPNKED